MTTRTLSFRLRYLYNYLTLILMNVQRWPSLASEEGEGVISTAIVVLIISFLAVGMWAAFKVIMGNATASISSQVSQLGQ